MKFARIWLLAMVVLTGTAFFIAGCGEKIAIPEPVGLFSGSPYRIIDTFEDPGGPVQLTVANSTLLVLAPNSLTKRDQNYGEIAFVEGFGDARALCVDEQEQRVFVFDKQSGRVSWFSTSNLDFLGSTELPDVQDVVSMAVCAVGIDQFPGAQTYLYLSDPDSAVVHRYAFGEVAGLNPHGILCRSNGISARFVHEPLGLARDSQDSLLVCDGDTSRNWVMRFVSQPDVTDVTENPDDEDPLRGRAGLWDNSSECTFPPLGDYVLGNAPSECNETGWVGGTSTAAGEFNSPSALAIDGSGRIFVADRGNSRVQVFDATGDYVLLFGNPIDTPEPMSIGVVDKFIDSTNINFGAYVYVLSAGTNTVLKYISSEQAIDENVPPPPDIP